MLRIEKVLANAAPALARRAATLTLAYDERCRSRLAATLDDGREAALFLPRGTILREGSLLVATDGSLVRVVAAPQQVLRVTSSDPLLLLRAAYHLGNRHTPVQVAADALQLEYDPVLRDMLERLGVTVASVRAPFDPEAGAYGGGHRHGHDATFAEDHALAQAVYAERHGGAHRHDHDHGHDHGHDRGDGHEHSHAHDHGHDHDHGHTHAGDAATACGGCGHAHEHGPHEHPRQGDHSHRHGGH
ncbi:urease accessory protein UreE [Verticiella sediminum]|uniref:Urease accessory protein UreE n=1 Tax=Verticiella sediminum TaxID=1247510 RepID=A0A556ARK3_9BURK|nr:urease accessory protein UreE [Verticiella sediminum]TSH95557.1 urease accessory protein UreE [Verticiella sediminum]